MVSIKVNGNVQELWPAPCLNIKSTILPFTMINFSIVTIFQLTQHHIRSESSGKKSFKNRYAKCTCICAKLPDVVIAGCIVFVNCIVGDAQLATCRSFG
jgi:hypothetical protein